jgi:DNA-binding transcriptional ArsR family regulator
MDERMEEEIYELHQGICSALADPKRILIIYTLAEKPHNVSELSSALGMPQPTTSRHLKNLRERGLVDTSREGTSIIYSISDRKLVQALDLLRQVLRGVYTHRAALFAGNN